MLSSLFLKKPSTHQHKGPLLHQALTAFDLTLLGIGAIIGAGVFVLTGVAAATKAGPAIILSYVVASLASLFSALSYAELASSLGGTGSAYHYAYVGFGEFIAWVIGWILLLEYFMSVVTVSIGWSGYMNNLLTSLHFHVPNLLSKTYAEGGGINFFAALIILILTSLLCIGIKHSARFNAAMVFIKTLTIALFLTVAAQHLKPGLWSPFFPFGWQGVMNGAALVFFAYIGFDALSTTVEETINPQRSVPIGILASLLICTLTYIAVSACLTGIVHYSLLNVESPVSEALLLIGYPIAAGLIAAGAIAGLTTVMLVMFYALSRILLGMARDGLIPSNLSYLHPKTHTPIPIILILGLLMSLISAFTPIHQAAELVNIGTLTAFTFVSLGVIHLRKTQPRLARPFRLPFNPIIPSLGVIACLYLMLQLSSGTWLRFGIWSSVGVILYFLYGFRHSALRK